MTPAAPRRLSAYRLCEYRLRTQRNWAHRLFFVRKRPKITSESHFLPIHYPRSLRARLDHLSKISWENGTWECHETWQGVYQSTVLTQDQTFGLKMLLRPCSARLKTVLDSLGSPDIGLTSNKLNIMTLGGQNSLKIPKIHFFVRKQPKISSESRFSPISNP